MQMSITFIKATSHICVNPKWELSLCLYFWIDIRDQKNPKVNLLPLQACFSRVVPVTMLHHSTIPSTSTFVQYAPTHMEVTPIRLDNENAIKPRQWHDPQSLETPMVVLPLLFALYCFKTLNPWKTSNAKLHNENTTQPWQWYDPQSLRYSYGCHATLVCSQLFWNLKPIMILRLIIDHFSII